MRKTFTLLALTLLSACATTGGSSPGITDGRWKFALIDGQKPVSDKAELTFTGDRIGASVGCNRMNGSFKIKGSTLEVGPMASTMMYCEGLMDQERVVGALFGANPTYQIGKGRMMLSGGGHSAELVSAE